MNEKADIRKLQLEVLNREDMPVRTYHILYDANEGPKYRLKIGKHTYSVTADGELQEMDNQPIINPKFTPYD